MRTTVSGAIVLIIASTNARGCEDIQAKFNEHAKKSFALLDEYNQSKDCSLVPKVVDDLRRANVLREQWWKCMEGRGVRAISEPFRPDEWAHRELALCRTTRTPDGKSTAGAAAKGNGSCSQATMSYISIRRGGKGDCIGAGCYVFSNSCTASAITVSYQASDGFGSSCSVLNERNIKVPKGSPGEAIDFSCSPPRITRAEFSK